MKAPASRPVPAALTKRGITGMADNLPTGASIDIASEFVKAFRTELELRVLGIPEACRRPARADFSGARS